MEPFERRLGIFNACLSLLQLFATVAIPIAAYYIFDQFRQEFRLKKSPVVTRKVISEDSSASSFAFDILNPGQLPIKDAVIQISSVRDNFELPDECKTG